MISGNNGIFKKAGEGATKWTSQAGYEHIKGVAALTDSSKWTAYKTSDAEWAIGAAPLEDIV